jgi:hypothetical protein
MRGYLLYKKSQKEACFHHVFTVTKPANFAEILTFFLGKPLITGHIPPLLVEIMIKVT